MSLAEQIKQLPPSQLAEVLAGFSAEQLQAVKYDWSLWARPEQLPPDANDWRTFLYLAGRGAGKTRSAAEWVRKTAREQPGCRGAIVARTAGDVRDVCIEGESGILAISPRWERPEYEPSKRRLTWPNGSQATCYSADEPDLLRGPQHDFAWADELASWPRADETWANLQLGLRLGQRPRAVATTTPRPIPIVRELLASASTIVRRGSTYDNAANLAPSALAEYRSRYEGTRIGRQELHGELLQDTPGALWTLDVLDKHRARAAPAELERVVVGVDPAVTSNEKSDETGIVVAGKVTDHAAGSRSTDRFFVLEDASLKASPDVWARRVVAAFDKHHADVIVVEVNQGGDLVRQVLEQVRHGLPIRTVHAKRGKALRAEPVSMLYEQGRVSHVSPPELINPPLAQLEEQMCNWTPSDPDSPDRVDALVYALLELSESVSHQGLLDYMREQIEEQRQRRYGGPRLHIPSDAPAAKGDRQ